MEKNKIIRLIVSLLISVALWVYVINVVNPVSSTVVRNIPVNLIGSETLQEKNLAIVGDGNYTVDITVKASRSDLGVLSPDLFQAVADVSELTLGQDYISVSVSSPSGYTVEDIRSRKIQVYVDELYKKTVPVEVSFTSAAENYEASAISVYPSKVEVSGAKQLIDSVEKYVVSIDSASLKLEDASELKLLGESRDSSGNKLNGLSVSVPEIAVSACIYSTKTVNLNVRIDGKPWEGASIVSKLYPSNITIKGPAELLSGISEVQTKWIVIDGIYEDFSKPLDLILPSGVYVADKDADSRVEIDIADDGEISFNYACSSIDTLNASGSLRYKYSIDEDYIKLVVRGPVAILKTVSASDISLTVDASGLGVGNRKLKLGTKTNISGINFTLEPTEVYAEIR